MLLGSSKKLNYNNIRPLCYTKFEDLAVHLRKGDGQIYTSLDTDIMKVDIVLYKCSGCTYINTSSSRISQHTQLTQCKGCKTVRFVLSDVDIPESIPDVSQLQKQKRGPKPFDIDTYMKNKVPAFTEAACDERLEYLFETPDVLHACFKGEFGIQNIIACFSFLWGSRAPLKFRSIVKYHKEIHVLEDVDEDTGEPLTINSYKSIKEFINLGFLTEFFDFLDSMCRFSIPARAPELRGKGERILEIIQIQQGGFTLQDAMESTSEFQKNRHKVPELNAKSKQIRTALRNAIETCTPPCKPTA